MTGSEAALAAFEVEVPSWAFGNSGTRFATFSQPGVPRTPREKLEDAAQVHRYTGTAPSVALHIPWDLVEDYEELRDQAEELGVRLGTINPNLFQEPEYKLGSVANPDATVQRKAVDHILDCVAIAVQTRSGASGSSTRWPRSTRRCPTRSSCSSNTSCTSPRSTRPTSRIGAQR
jgi:L-rhamnose isomerase / sugar isomerase